MSDYQWVWLALFGIGGVVEVLALVNRSKNDTLSEQFWLILGVFPKRVCLVDGNSLPCPQHLDSNPYVPPQSRRLPPAWVRVRRTAFLAGTAWLVLHFATGWV